MEYKNLRITPITFKAACAFVKEKHRHNKAPQGHKFSIGITCDGILAGVAMIGRPISRHFDNGFTCEVTRTCTDGSKNANSMLYGAAWKAARAMGYTKIITYTQHDESGISLHAAGWKKVKEINGYNDWQRSDRALKEEQKNTPVLSGVVRILWEITCN